MFMPTKGFYDAPVVVTAVATEQFNAFEAMGCDMDEFCVETLDQATDHSDASLCDLIEDIAGQLRVLARRFLSGALQRTVACGVRGEGKRFVAYGTTHPLGTFGGGEGVRHGDGGRAGRMGWCDAVAQVS
jgi:hypothetical protein